MDSGSLGEDDGFLLDPLGSLRNEPFPRALVAGCWDGACHNDSMELARRPWEIPCIYLEIPVATLVCSQYVGHACPKSLLVFHYTLYLPGQARIFQCCRCLCWRSSPYFGAVSCRRCIATSLLNFTNLASALALGMRCCIAFPAQEKHCCTCAQGLDQQTASIGQQRPWGRLWAARISMG